MNESQKITKTTALKNLRSKRSTHPEIDVNKTERRSVYSYKRNRLLIIVITLISIVSVFGYLGYKNLILAWVDNTPITKLTLYSQLEEKYGKDFTEQLISETLILKEAQKKGVQVSEDDINGEIKKIEDQQGGAEKLKQAMDSQNVTLTQLRNQIKYKQMIDKAFGKDVAVTDQEVNEYMKKNKAQIPPTENMSASESARLKQQIGDSLKNEKINKLFEDWLRESLKGSRVKRLTYKGGNL